MKLLLYRKWCKEDYTLGNLYLIDGDKEVWLCNTMEDKVRDLNKNGKFDEGEKKVYGQTAIPYGIYVIDMNTVSPKFKDRVWAKKYNGIVPRLMNVPNFEGVLIHPLNKALESLGCIGCGRNTIKGQITQATATHYNLMDNFLLPAHRRSEEITIEIV